MSQLLDRVRLLKQGSAASDAVDLIRAVAAISVTLFHVRSHLYVGIDDAQHAGVITKAIYFATGIGSEWVMVFFVLSGYLIGQSVARSVREGRWSWRSYLINRLSRLWMVLLPALLLTALWDLLGARLFIGAGSLQQLGWQTFLGNLFFLNGIVAPQYGSNVPLWSLPYEFWYYMLFPCLVLVFVPGKVWQRTLCGAGALAMALFVGPQILLYFLVWLMGCLVLVLPPLRLSRAGQAAAVVGTSVAFVGATAASKLGLFPSTFVAYFAVGVTFTAFLHVLLSVLQDAPGRAESGWGRMARFLASFSYTLYLTHFPLRNFLFAWRDHLGWQPWQPTFGYLLLGLVVLAAVMGFAWLVYLGTEARTDVVRRLAMKWTAPKRQGQALQERPAQ